MTPYQPTDNDQLIINIDAICSIERIKTDTIEIIFEGGSIIHITAPAWNKENTSGLGAAAKKDWTDSEFKKIKLLLEINQRQQ